MTVAELFAERGQDALPRAGGTRRGRGADAQAPRGGRARRRRARRGADAHRARRARVHGAPRDDARGGVGARVVGRAAARSRPGGVLGALRGAHAALRRRRRRARARSRRRCARGSRRPRLGGRGDGLAGLVPGDGSDRARGRRRGRAASRRARAGGSRRARSARRTSCPRASRRRRRTRLRGSGRRSGSNAEETLVALGGGSTTDLAGFVAATYLRGVAWAAGADHARRAGRRRDRREDGDRPRARQEPRRRVPLAGAHDRRPAAPGDAPGRRARERARRGREDRACSPASRSGSSSAASRFAGAPRSRPPSASATRSTAPSAASSTSATRSRTRWRPPPASRFRTGGRSRSGCSRRCGSPGSRRTSGRSESCSAPSRRWSIATPPGRRSLRDKKASGGSPRLVLLDAPGEPRVGVELDPAVVRAALDALIA